MVARHKRHSKHWERSSPAQRQLDPRFNRLSIKSKRPSSTRRDFVPQYNRHSDDSEWPSPAPNNRHFLWRLPRHDVQSINVVMAARHKRHSKHWERSFPAQRQLDPRFNGLSIKSKRPSSTRREFVPQYNRHSDDSEWPFPAPNNRHFLWRSPRHDVQSFNVVMAARHKRHSKHWERSSPAQRQLDPRFNRLSIKSKRPSSTRREFVPQYNRHSDDSEWPSPAPNNRHFLWRSPRHDVQSINVVMAARHKRHSKHWERSSPAQRQLDPRFNGLSIKSERPSSTRREFVPQYRHSDDSERPSPVPNNRHFMWRLPRHDVQSTRSIAYPERAVFKWLPTGLENDNHFPPSVCLKQISLEPTKKTGQNPSLVLVNSRLGKDKDEEGGNVSRRPWESVAEKVWPDLLSCLENVRKKMKGQDLEEVYPKFVARFGKNIFHGNASRWFDNVRKGQLPETTLGKLTKSFNTNVPTSYTEKIIREAVPKIGVGFDDKKDIYHVRLSDSTQKDSIISCKCTLNNDKKLVLYKVKLIHQLRHMVVNVSCLDKDVDLRLMLSGKRILTALTDYERQRISNLINSAVVDPEKKGGFRWPQTVYSQSSRYKVVGIWHTISEVYKSPSLLLEVRSANRYNFETATEDARREVSLKFKGIVSELLAQKRESDSIYGMFKDTLGIIWEHFLCCEQFLTTSDYIEEVGGQKH